MGISYGPSIVDDSITFNIDAANLKCYDPRENLTTNSQGAFNNITYWPKVTTTGFTITDNTSETVAPDGTFTASKVICTTTANDGSSSIYQDFAISSGTGTYTVSVYIKGSSGTGQVTFQSFLLWTTINGFLGMGISPTVNTSGTANIVIEDVGNGWKRYSITGTGDTAANNTYRLQIYFDNADNTTFYMWGVQVERKSSVGPYVATSTAALTKPLPCNNLSVIPSLESVSNSSRVMYDHRNAGSFTFDGNANLVRSSLRYDFPGGGSVDVWFKLGVIGTQQGIFYISDGGTNLVNFWYNNSTLRWETAKAGVGTTIVSTTVLAANTWYHAVGTWDYTSIKLYLNGELQAQTNTANQPFTITGGTAIGTYSSNMTGNISAVKVYNKPLTANEVKQNFNALRQRYSI
jgi:hypothetical protein